MKIILALLLILPINSYSKNTISITHSEGIKTKLKRIDCCIEGDDSFVKNTVNSFMKEVVLTDIESKTINISEPVNKEVCVTGTYLGNS